MRVLLIAFSLLLYQLYSFSQEFEVKPMKLFFDSTTTTGIINIYNKSDKKNQFGIFYKDYEKFLITTSLRGLMMKDVACLKESIYSRSRT